MRRFRLDLAYDGGAFHGWQRQEGLTTVQESLETALESLVKTRVSVAAAGRTDAGVHARHQVASFDAQTRMDGQALRRALNSLLPPTVRILEAAEAAPDFHARFSARARVYHYQVLPAETGLPWEEPYCWRLGRGVNLDRLQRMASLLIGEKDFTTFCAAGDPSPHRRRRIFQSQWFPQGPFLVYRVTGNAFLWHMVRSLVGTMTSLARQAEGVEAFAEALEAQDRSRAGATAPAKGLFLHKVVYEPHEFPY